MGMHSKSVHLHRKTSTSAEPGLLPSHLSDSHLEQIRQRHHRKRGPTSVLSFSQLLRCLVYHVSMQTGRLEQHVQECSGLRRSRSTLSERRQALPWEMFQEILDVGLVPRADPQRHPSAFYQGLRLIGLDGSSEAVYNTPDISRRWEKASSRRGSAAFARVGFVILVELGLHNPIGARLGRKQQSEYVLACEALAQMPPRSLLLGDRLYGRPSFLARLLQRCVQVGGQFLVRARRKIRRRILKRLADGSRLVRLDATDEEGQAVSIEVREIRGQIQRPGKRPVSIRLWTSLLDWEQHPAHELLELYAQRWEVELTVKEIKRTLQKQELLQSYTVETALQEIAALLLAQAAMAEVRAQVAEQERMEVLRISHGQVVRWVQWLWMGWAAYPTPAQRSNAMRHAMEQIVMTVTPKRRKRSCPRGLRQPVSSWPRIRRRTESNDAATVRVLSFSGSHK